jgi:hypothetical protein
MKYPRTYHLPFSKGTTNDDRISDDISTLLNIPIIISEKLDGENCSMTNNGVYARSHASFTTSPWSIAVRTLHDIKVRGNLEEDVYLFGENMEGMHSIEYKNLTSFFYLFGARENNKWMEWDKVEEYAYLLDLELVPVLFKGIVKTEKELIDIINMFMNSESKLGGEIEGVVVRNAGSFNEEDFSKNVLKLVRENHVQTDQHWTKNWKRNKLNY